MLTAYEGDTHDMLMWLGGKAAKHSSDAKSQQDAPENLSVLLKRDPKRYERVVSRATSMYDIDEDGYTSIVDLLEQTQALDQTRELYLRPSDKALARIALDVKGRDSPKSHWVGNRTRGRWKALLSNSMICLAQIEVLKLLRANKSVVEYDGKPFKQKEYDSDFEDEDGNYTVLPPTRLIGALLDDDAPHSGLTSSDEENNNDHSRGEDPAPFKAPNIDDVHEDEEKEKKPPSPTTTSADMSSASSTK
ncbi:hypothetical protein PI124_g13552 [Phytophthora idaei]|nr:hypothetical protein PI125_g14371 [Phytophthora idaei]KAG3145842.1 hypothetical protein PI126_g13576 [Phytophthora idaei]KAG3241584.1 hypothetical protein PI124_g13552 [Phytophthora idaei]